MWECGFDLKAKHIVTLCCCLAHCGYEFARRTCLVRDNRINAFTGEIKPLMNAKKNKKKTKDS